MGKNRKCFEGVFKIFHVFCDFLGGDGKRSFFEAARSSRRASGMRTKKRTNLWARFLLENCRLAIQSVLM